MIKYSNIHAILFRINQGGRCDCGLYPAAFRLQWRIKGGEGAVGAIAPPPLRDFSLKNFALKGQEFQKKFLGEKPPDQLGRTIPNSPSSAA